MSWHRFLSLVVCVPAVAVLSGCAQRAPEPREADPAEVLAREEERVKYLVSGDLDRLADVLSPTLSYTHSNAALDTKDQFLESLRSGRVVYRNLKHHDVNVRFVNPGVAVMNGQSDVSVTVGGQDQEVPLRFTIVYVERDGRWLFEAWHSVRRPE